MQKAAGGGVSASELRAAEEEIKRLKDQVGPHIWFCVWSFLRVSMGYLASLIPRPYALLAVRNSRRGPGLIHHVMSATVVFLRQQVAVLPIYMYNGVSS